MDAQTAPHTETAPVRRKRPRSAATYRAARRNQVLRPPDDKKGVWRGYPAIYEPYQSRPPIVKYDPVSNSFTIRNRKQPKTYRPNGARECARRLRRLTSDKDLSRT